MKVHFKNPPINELVIAAYFDTPIAALRSEHIGLFWGQVKKSFPMVVQKPPIGDFSITLENEPFPMPRFWLIDDDDCTLIQIQKNAFFFNWRKRAEAYPHYDSLKASFDKHFSVFKDFLRKEGVAEELSIALCELAYINTISECEYWGNIADTQQVIPSFCPVDIGTEEKPVQNVNCTFIHPLEDDLDVRVNIRNGRTVDEDKELLVMEIKTSGRLIKSDQATVDDWYERGHDAIINSFLGMTNPEIQKKYWQRDDKK